ncbi:flagellar biosynthesis anti-sigma factor FlgM [Trinickia terrae]|uniref:Negative regulator of flagellin synthesis n=1 Tax=Trinickia terrae TaxID=2571161 RepID=A0A4U1I788_9BURK|nr:flagellar biosynthesis anti-sigma factor FlgM [Trinickia terrae]TKC89258.1 flagellar biosynthesis anti-sigma factor FlgM [Trinickia terrae]
MKIDSTTNSSLPALKDGAQRTQQGDSATAAASSAPKAPAQGASGAAGDANVNLSGLSSSLRSLAASGSADIDTAQVESIKQAIKDGTLKIDTSKIADGVLETARGLLQKNPSTGG